VTDLYNQVVELIRKDVIKFTPQLFYSEDHAPESEPLAFASSVLVKYKNDYLLITAGHVFQNEDPNTIGVMLQNDFCVIGGMLKGFDLNEEDSYNPKNLDIAIFKLDEITVNMFKEQYQFLELNNSISFSSINARYLIFGYPAELTISKPSTKTIVPRSMSLRTIGADLSYYKDNIHINKTIILLADQENIASSDIKSTTKISDLGGISGCGVWKVIDLSTEKPQYELVSFITGENEFKTALYSSRLNIVLDLLKYF
jgi:hypothetical protein